MTDEAARQRQRKRRLRLRPLPRPWGGFSRALAPKPEGLAAADSKPARDLDLRVERRGGLDTSVFERRFASTVLQAWARGLGTRELAWGDGGIWQCQAALAVQRAYRGRLGLRRARELRRTRDARAATRMQGCWRRRAARAELARRRAARRLRSAGEIQRVWRGTTGRAKAIAARRERDDRCARAMQRAVRSWASRGKLAALVWEEERRVEAVAGVSASALEHTTTLRALLAADDGVSDHDIRKDAALQGRALRTAMLMFGVFGDIDGTLHLLSRLLRCNPGLAGAHELKAVVLLVSGARPRFHSSKHGLFFVELALDHLDLGVASCASGASSASQLAPEGALEGIPEHAFADLGDFFFICVRAAKGQYDEFRALMNFAVALQCRCRSSQGQPEGLQAAMTNKGQEVTVAPTQSRAEGKRQSNSMARAGKFWRKASVLLERRSRCKGAAAVRDRNKAWVGFLERQHHDFWKHELALVVRIPFRVPNRVPNRVPTGLGDGAEELTLSRRGRAVVVSADGLGPLVAPFSQLAAVVRSAKTRRRICARARAGAPLAAHKDEDKGGDKDDHEREREGEREGEERDGEVDDVSWLEAEAEAEAEAAEAGAEAPIVASEAACARFARFARQIRVLQLRASARPKLVVPALEKQRAREVVRFRRTRAANDIQRVLRGMVARAEWRRRDQIRQSLERQSRNLVEKRLVRLRLRERRRAAAARLQGAARGRAVRAELRLKNAAACGIQRLVRGHLGRIAAEELERRQRMGALVTQVFRGARTLLMGMPMGNPVAGSPPPQKGSGESGLSSKFLGGDSESKQAEGLRPCHVFLTVLKSGDNYLATALDLGTGQEYRGTIREQRLEAFLRKRNRGRPTAEHIRKHNGDLLPLLLANLRVVPPMSALTSNLAALEGPCTIALGFLDVDNE